VDTGSTSVHSYSVDRGLGETSFSKEEPSNPETICPEARSDQWRFLGPMIHAASGSRGALGDLRKR
jgi:hypothetical protein